MPRPKKWIKTFFDHGIEHTRLSSWKYFPDYINQHMLNFPGYIYRGQRSEHWKMESTLDRLIRKIPVKQREKIKDFILANFLYAIRGRRGDNPCKLTDNEMWSLGQHHGLSTPMLDFTLSPYVAAFSALAEGRDVVDGDATVWAVHDYSITEKSKEITKDLVGIDNSAPALIKRIEPLIDENARLVNQSGCFLY